jgi:hypothetical protein
MSALLGGHVDVVSATGPGGGAPGLRRARCAFWQARRPVRGTGPLANVKTWREQGVDADYVSYNGVLLPGASMPNRSDSGRRRLRQVAAIAAVDLAGGNLRQQADVQRLCRITPLPAARAEGDAGAGGRAGTAGAMSTAHTSNPPGEWMAELTELQTRREQARAMGGHEALAKFKATGRMNARERITHLLDEGQLSRTMDSLGRQGPLQPRRYFRAHSTPPTPLPAPALSRAAKLRSTWTTTPSALALRKRPLPTSGSTSSAWRTSCACQWCVWSIRPAAVSSC